MCLRGVSLSLGKIEQPIHNGYIKRNFRNKLKTQQPQKIAYIFILRRPRDICDISRVGKCGCFLLRAVQSAPGSFPAVGKAFGKIRRKHGRDKAPWPVIYTNRGVREWMFLQGIPPEFSPNYCTTCVVVKLTYFMENWSCSCCGSFGDRAHFDASN